MTVVVYEGQKNHRVLDAVIDALKPYTNRGGLAWIKIGPVEYQLQLDTLPRYGPSLTYAECEPMVVAACRAAFDAIC